MDKEEIWLYKIEKEDENGVRSIDGLDSPGEPNESVVRAKRLWYHIKLIRMNKELVT